MQRPVSHPSSSYLQHAASCHQAASRRPWQQLQLFSSAMPRRFATCSITSSHTRAYALDSKLLFIKLLTQPQMGEEEKRWKKGLCRYKRRRELPLGRLAGALRKKRDWKAKEERNRKGDVCFFLSWYWVKRNSNWFGFWVGLKAREERELVSGGTWDHRKREVFFALPCDICLCFFRMMLL